MKLTFRIIATAVATFLVTPVTADAVDDEWLNTIWTQVDDMV